MNPPESDPVTTFKSRGAPGASVRSRGLSQALFPVIGMVFASGWAIGAVVPPSFLTLGHAAVLLIVLAFGVLITWKRALSLLSRHEEGARGEEKVARVLEALPEGWRIYHGVPLAGKTLDHVVVSPEQVYLIETVHWPGQVQVLDGHLMHGEEAYTGYELATLLGRGDQAADELGVPRPAVSCLVCIVGGRYHQHPGEKDGVWIGEIQDLGPYLLQHQGAGIDTSLRLSVLETLDTRLDKEKTL
jgi:hypothetical protein